jgi:hypothetical protein
VLDAIAADDERQQQYLAVQQDLSRNVAAAIYLAAMKGSIPAQTFFLRQLPPPNGPPPPHPRQSTTAN